MIMLNMIAMQFVSTFKCYFCSFFFVDVQSKMKRSFMKFSLVFLLGMILLMVSHLNPTNRTKKNFVGQNLFANTSLLEWICIPPRNPRQRPPHQCRQKERTFVVFKSKRNDTTNIGGITVSFNKGKIPKDYHILHDYTGIFNTFQRIYRIRNLFHYIIQVYIPFHHLLEIWRDSKLSKHSHIFYSHPVDDKCAKYPFATFFLGALPESKETAKYFHCYNSHPGGICYRYGILSGVHHGGHSFKAIQHLKKHYGMDKTVCPGNLATLLQRRKTRRWLNIQDSKKALLKAGYKNTQVVDFENYSLREQLRTVHCSSVFVGPHSAALEWVYFMQTDGSAIEIAWPYYGWPFFYSDNNNPTCPTKSQAPHKIYQIAARNVTNLGNSAKVMIKIALGEKYANIPNLTSAENIE